MPELPEVECIRFYLQRECAGASVVLHQLAREDIVGTLRSPRGQRSQSATKTPRALLLDGSTLSGVERKGKQLALVASNGRSCIVRLGMSGQLLLVDSIDPKTKHVHASWLLRSGGRSRFLLFRDPRRFGSILPCRDRSELDAHWSRLGPDALTLSFSALSEIVSNRSVGVKALLLNQARTSGLGNIYVDEALFSAGVHPRMPAENLNKKQIKILASTIRSVLSKATAVGGTTLRDYRMPDGSSGRFQAKHRVYGRKGQLCTACKSTILGESVAGRTTSFCPKCQVLSMR